MGIDAAIAVFFAGFITLTIINTVVYPSSVNETTKDLKQETSFKSRHLLSVEEDWVEETPIPQLTYEISGDTYPEAVDGGSILEYTCLLVYKVEPEHTAINISFEVDLPFSSFHEDSFNVTLYSEALGILPHQTIDENVDDEKSKAAVKILHLFHDPIVQKVYVKVDISESMWVNLTEPWKRPDCWWVPAFPDCYQTLYSECVFYDKSPEQTWDPAYCYQFKVSDCLPFNTTTECYYINTTSCLMALIADAERPQDMLCPTDVNETDCIQINDRGLFFTQYDFSVPTVAPIPETYEKDFCGMSMESIWMTEETAYERQYTYDSTIEEDENGCVRVLMRIKPIITTPPPTYNPYKALRKTEKYINAKTCMNANTTGFYTQPIQPINWKDFNITILFTGEIFNYVEVNQVLVSEVYVNITQSTKLINQIRRVFAIQKIPIKRPGYWVYNNPTFSDRNFTLKHEQILHHGVLIHPEAFNRGFTMTIDVPKVDDVYLAKFENITPWWKTGKHFAAISDYHMFNSTYNTNGDELTLETVIDKMEGYYDGDSRLPDITSEWVVEQNDYGEEIIVQCIFSVTPFLNIKDVVWRDHGRLNFYLYSRVLSSVVADNELKFSITADFKFPPGDELILYASRTSTVTVQPFVPRIPPVNATQEPDCQDDITYTFELFNILEFSIKDIWMNVTCPDLVIIPSTLEVEIIHHVNVTSDSNADIMLTTDQTYHIHYTELAPQVLARGQQTFRLVNNGIAPHYSIVCKVYLSFRKDNKALVLPYLAGVSNELFTPGIEYILYGRDLIEKEEEVMILTTPMSRTTVLLGNATAEIPIMVDEEVSYGVEEETTPLMYSMPVGSNATFIINITVPEITTEIEIYFGMPAAVLAVYYSRIIFIGGNIINLDMVDLEKGSDIMESWDMTTRTNLKQKLGNLTNIADNLRNESDNIVLEFNVVLLDEKETVVKDTEHEFKTTVIYTNGQDLVQQQSVAVLEPDIQVYLRVANESTNADPGEIFQYYIKVNHTSVSQSPAHHINVTIHLPYMIINKHFLPYEYSRVPVRGKKFEPGFEYENDEILLLYLYKLDLDEVIEGTFLVQITTKLMEGICLQAQVKYEMSSFYQWGRYYPYTTVSENVLNIRNATLKFIGTSLHDTPDKLVAIHEQVTYRITIPLPPISSNLTIEIFLPTRNVTRKIWEVLQIQEEIPEVLPIEETFFDNGCYTVMRPCFCYGAGNMSFDASWFISRFTCKLKTDQMCTNSTDLDTGESNITNCDYSPDVYSKCRNLSKEMCFQNENVTTYLQTPISHFQQMACNMSNSTMNNNGTAFNHSSSFPWNCTVHRTEADLCHEFSTSFCENALFTECSYSGVPHHHNESESMNVTKLHLDDYIGNWSCACLKETEEEIQDVKDPFEGLNLTAILEGHYNASKKPYQVCSSLLANKSLLAKPIKPSDEQPYQNLSSSDHQNLTEDEGFYPIPDFCFEETIIELGMAKVVNTSIVTTREGVICTFTGGNNHNPHQPGVKYKAMNLPGFGLGGDSVSVYVTMVISDEVENVRDETLFINASSTFMYLNIPIPPPLRYEENCTCSKPLTHYFDVDYPLDCGCESMYLVGHKRDLCNCTTTFHEIEESYFSAPSCDCVNFCENNVQYFFNQPMVKNLADFDNATCDCGSYKDFSNSQNNFDYLSECREMYFRNYTCQNVNHTVKKTVEECRNITSKNCLEVNELQDINVAWLCQCSSDGLNCSCEFDSFPLSPNFANYSIVECQNMPWVKTNDGYNGDISLCDCHITNGSPAKSCHCSGVCSIHITNSCTAYNHTFCEDVTHLREYLVNDGLCICEKFYGSNHTIQDALRLYKYHNNTKIILKNQTMNGIEDSQFKNGTFLNVTMSNSTATNANETTQVLYKDQLSLDDFVLYCNCSDVDIIIPDIKPVQCKEIAPKEVFVCQCFVPADNETQLILDNWDYNLTIVDEAVTYLGDEFVVIEPELEISFVRIEPNPVDIVDSLDFVKFGYKIQHTDSSNSPAYNLTLFLDAVNFTITNGSGKVLPTDILSSRSCSDETLCEISYDNEVGHFHLGFLPVDVDGASFEGTFSLALRDDVDFVANSIISGTGILWYDSCVVDFPGRLYGPINSSDICHIYAPNITAKLEFTTAYAYMYQNEEYGIPNTFSIGDYVDIRAHLWVPEITLNVANYSISGDNMFSFTPVMAVMLLTDRIYVRNDTATFFLDQRHNPHDNEFHILYPDEQYDTAEFTDKGIAFIPGVLVNQADNIASPEDYLLLKFIFTLKDDPLWKQDDIIPFTVSVVYYSDYDGQLLTLIDKNVELKVVEPRLTLRVEILDYKWQVEQVQNTTGYTCVENTCCEDGEPCDTGRVCVTDSSDMDNCETHRCLCYSGFALNAESTCTAVGRTAGDILVFGLTVFHSQEYTGNAFDLYITLYSDLKSDLLPDTDTMGHIPTDGYLGNVRKPRLTQISDHEFQLYVHRFDHVVSCERFTVPFRIKPSLHVFAGQTWEVEATMNYRSSKPYDTPFNIKSRLYDMKDMNDTIRFPLFAPAPSVRFKMLPSSGQSSPINFEVFSSSMAQNEVMVNVREEDKIVFQAEVVIPKIKCSMTFKLNLPEGSGITLENVTMVSMGTAIDFPETNFGEPQVTESIDGQKFFFAYFPDIHSKANTLNTPRSLDSTKQQMFKSMNGEQQPYPTNPECNALNSSLYEQTILLGCYHNKMSYFGGFITDMHPSLPFYNLSQVMTRQLCLDHCSDRRYDYAGLLKGAICLCGTEEQFMQYYQNRTFELNGTLHHATLDHCSTLCTGENASCGSMEFALLYGPIPGSVPKQQCDWYSGLYDETEDVFVVEFSLSIHSLATKGIEEYLHLQVTYDHGENKTSTLLPLAPYKIETGIVKLLMNVYVSPKMSGYVPGDYLEYYTEVRHAAHSTVTARDVYILWMLPSYIEYVNVTNHPSLPFTYRHIEDVENVETDPRVGIKFYVKTLFHDDVIGFHFMVRLDPLHTLPQGEYHLMSMTQVYYDSWGIHNHFEEDYTFDVVPHAHPVVPIKITFEVPSKYSGREQLDDIKLSTYNVLYDEINNIVYACFFNNTINVYKGGCFMTGDLPSYLTETPHTCEDYCNCTYLENHLTFDNCSNYEPRPSNCTCGCVPDCIEDMMSCEIDCLNNTFSNADLSSCLAGCKRVQVNCTQGCCIDTCDKDLDLCLLNNCVECNYFANCSVELKCAEQCISKNDGCSQTCIRSPVTCHENCSSASWDCLLNCNQLCGESTNTNCKEYCYSDCLADENRCLSDCCYTDCNVNATLCTQQCSTDCRLDGNCIISCLSNCNSTGFTCNETCAAQVYDCQDNCNQNCSVTSCTVIIETDCAEEEVNDLVENILTNYSLTNLHNNGIIGLEKASLMLTSVNCSGNSCTTEFQVTNTSSSCSATATEYCQTDLDSSCAINCVGLCEATSSCIGEYLNCLDTCGSDPTGTCDVVLLRNVSIDFCLIDALNCILMMSNCYLSCNSSESCLKCDDVYCASNYTQCVEIVTMDNRTYSADNVLHQTLNLTDGNSCLSECNRNLTKCQQVCRQHNNVSYICHSTCLRGHYGCASQCLTYINEQSICGIADSTTNTNETNLIHNSECNRQCEDDLVICKQLFSHIMNRTVNNITTEHYSIAVNCSSYKECGDICSNLCANTPSCSMFSCQAQCVQDATHGVCHSEVNCTILKMCVEHSRRRRRDADLFPADVTFGSSYTTSRRLNQEPLNHTLLVESRKRREAFIAKENSFKTVSSESDLGNVWSNTFDMRHNIQRIRRSLHDADMNNTYLNISIQDGGGFVESQCTTRNQHLEYIKCLDTCLVYPNVSTNNVSGGDVMNNASLQNTSSSIGCDNCQNIQPSSHARCYTLCNQTDAFCSANCSSNCTTSNNCSCSEFCNRPLAECLAICDKTSLNSCNWCRSLSCEEDSFCLCDRVCVNMTFIEVNNSKCVSESYCTILQEMCFYDCECKLPQYIFRHWRGLDSNVGNLLGLLPEPYTLYGLAHDGRAIMQSFDFGATWAAILKSVWLEAKDKEQYIEATNLEEILNLEPNLVFQSEFQNDTFGVSGVGIHFLKTVYEWKVDGTWNCCK